MTIKTLIDKDDFQNKILQIIINKHYKNILENMKSNSEDFELGFIQGLIFGALYLAQSTTYYVEVGDEDKISK